MTVTARAPSATDVDGPISWRECGEGEPIVFLHGLGGSRTAWEPQLASLGEHFRCIAWDMPGYGASAPIEPLSFGVLADAVMRLLDHAELDRAHLVGESFGGMHALHTALRHPDRLSRLVLLNTSPAFGLDGTRADDWRRARLEPLDAGLEPSDFAEDVLTATAGPGLGSEMLAMRVAAFARINSSGLKASIMCLPSHNLLDRLSEVDAPSLVIAGELDAETPVSYSQRLVDGLARSELVVLPGIGHLSASESPEQVNTLIRHFLTADD